MSDAGKRARLIVLEGAEPSFDVRNFLACAIRKSSRPKSKAALPPTSDIELANVFATEVQGRNFAGNLQSR